MGDPNKYSPVQSQLPRLRHSIGFSGAHVTLDGRPVYTRLEEDTIVIGCTEISLEAVAVIVKAWSHKFPGRKMLSA